MVRTRPAWWLAAPSRLAGVSRAAARRWLFVLALALIVAAIVGTGQQPAPDFLHDAIVAAMRHGSGYYDALRDLTRADPDARATLLLPPALAAVSATLPQWAMLPILAGVAALLLWTGGLRIGALLDRSAAVAMAVTLLGAGIAAALHLTSATPHAGWAAILSALSIVVRSEERYASGCALICMGAVIDPAALVVSVTMGVFAAAERRRDEALGWLIATLVAVAVVAAHLWATRALNVALDGGWSADPSLPRLIGTVFPGLPGSVAAPLLLLAVLGWATVADPMGPRIVGALLAGVAVDGVLGLRAATLMTVLIAPGIALAPGALADLVRKVVDRRRITVTKVVR